MAPNGPALFDVGVNLTSSAFESDRVEIVQRARQAGVQQMLLIGSNLEDSQSAQQLTRQFEQCYCSVGIHPHYASEFTAQSLEALRALAHLPGVVAIGETGLDFNRNYSPPEAQMLAFEQQTTLAESLDMPLYLHQRDAHDALLEIIKPNRSKLNAILLHCFTGTQKELEDYLDMDCYIGITGWICDERRGTHLLPLLQLIPENRLVLETDAPYLLPRTLSPKPKSRRNEPAYLYYVLEQVAKALGITCEELAARTTDNARRLFSLNKTA